MQILKRFVSPAIVLMNRLKYPQKFVLISLLFVMPLMLVMYLLVTELNSRIEFTQKELYGTAYLRPVNQLLQTIPQRQLTLYQGFHQNQGSETLATFDRQIEHSFAEVESVDQLFGQILMSTEQLQASQQTWLALRQQGRVWSEASLKTYHQLLQRVDRLRSIVGNKSNLILDPDLDTYYLMDASLLKLPKMQAVLAETMLLSQQGLISQKITPVERGRLIALGGLLEEYKDELTKNMEVGFAHNPAGNLKPHLSQPLQQFTSTLAPLIQDLYHLVDEDTEPQLAKYLAVSRQAQGVGGQLWDQVIEDLDFLLQRRIHGFATKRYGLTVFVCIVLAIVVYLFIGFYLALIHTVSALDEAATLMADGTLSQPIILNNKDELGQVVRSFNHVAEALVRASREIKSLNQKLEADNLRMAAELSITRKLQEMILPKKQELARITNLDIAGFMQPAAEVGGDYYDVLHRNGLVKIGIGDVTGHGLESGVLMIMVQTAVRTLLEVDEKDPVKFLGAINRTIYDNVQRMNSDKNLTLTLLDYQEGRLKVSGQHEEMIVVRVNGQIERVNTIDLGFPIGLEADISEFIASDEVKLSPGDGIVLYTDGIPEAENAAGEQYGLDKLCDVIQKNWSRSAEDVRQAIIKSLENFIQGHHIYDDITLLVIKQK